MIYMVKMPNKYVTGVIQGTRELAIFLSLIPNNIVSQLEVEPIHPREYPFTILESEINGKRMFTAHRDEKETKMMISTIACVDGTPLATYDIKEDFVGDPEAPGTDVMGILSHTHLQED